MRVFFTLSLSFLVLLCGVVSQAQTGASVVSVRDFGAKGDGETDDSGAVLAAIQKAGTGGTVRFDPGSYKLTKPLVLKGVHLEGRSAGGWPADADMMPRLLIRHDLGPAIRCESFSSLHGLCMNYQNGGDAPKPYPAAIELGGSGVSITNLKIWGAYDAIMADGKANIGRVNLENIFLPEVFHTGVYLTKAYDIPTLRNVEVFCTNKYFFEHGVGFRFGRLDEMHASNNFVIGARIGILTEEDKGEGGGSVYGALTDCSTDFCQYGVVARGGELRISSGSYLSHHFGIVVEGPNAVVQISNSLIQANGMYALQVTACKNVNVTNTRFQRAFENPKEPMVLLDGGKNIVLSANIFGNFGPGIRVSARTDDFSITGNLFERSKFAKIEDNSSKSARKLIQSNLE